MSNEAEGPTREEQRELAKIERETTRLRRQINDRRDKINALAERKKAIKRAAIARKRAAKQRERIKQGVKAMTDEAFISDLIVLKEYCSGEITSHEMRTRHFLGSVRLAGKSLRKAWLVADPSSYERLGGDLRALVAEGPKDWMERRSQQP